MAFRMCVTSLTWDVLTDSAEPRQTFGWHAYGYSLDRLAELDQRLHPRTHLRVLKNSIKFRRSCLERIWPIPSGIGERAFRRVWMSAFLIVSRPVSGELRMTLSASSLLSTPAYVSSFFKVTITLSKPGAICR